jgi:hypothetical protein
MHRSIEMSAVLHNKQLNGTLDAILTFCRPMTAMEIWRTQSQFTKHQINCLLLWSPKYARAGVQIPSRWTMAGSNVENLQIITPVESPEPEKKKISVYLAGDWHEPPAKFADELEAAGCTIVSKWWESKTTHSMNVSLMKEEISSAHFVVLDMRSSRFADHAFAGSHLALGMALVMNRHVWVILPEDAAKGKTSLLSGNTTKDPNDVLKSIKCWRA